MLLAAGDLDLTYGVSGHVTADYGSGAAVTTKALASVIQADGMLVSVGENGIARFATDGSLDPSFGTEGIVVYPYYARLSRCKLTARS